MKKLMSLILIISCVALSANAQRYLTKTGHIWFHSEAPLETIEAHNHQVNAALDVPSGTLVFKVLMKSFLFEKALMQEHFNENYVESTTYPTAVFKGKVLNGDEIDFSNEGTATVKVEGELTLHGITNKIEADGLFTIRDGSVHGTSVFTIKIADYDISIPGAVAGKIAEEVDIHVDVLLNEIKY